MKKLIFTLMLIGCFQMIHSQNPMWTNYTNGDRIRAIVYAQPDVWVAYLGGLTKINSITGEKQYFNIVNTSPIVTNVKTISIDAQGSIWTGGYDGLGKYQNDTWTFYDTSNCEIPSNSIQTMAIDNANNIWIGAYEYDPNGDVYYLSKFDGYTWTNYTSSNSILPITGVNDIAVEQGNIIWASTRKGLLKISGEDWTLFDTENSNLISDYVTNIVVDKENIKWMFARDGDMLVSFDDINWEEFEQDFDNIKQIYVDKENNKWLCGGGNSGGISIFDGQDFTYYTTGNSNILSDFISSMAIDDNGVKWVGTEKISLITANNDDWSVINVSNSKVPACQIVAIEIDEAGKIWFGSTSFDFPYYDLSISNFDGQEWDLFKFTNNSTDEENIYEIIIDNENNKWLCTDSGLIKYSDQIDWTIYNTSNSLLNSNWVISGTLDQGGDIWIGLAPENNSQGGGILKIQGDEWTMFTSENSGLPNNNVDAIAADADGNIWIGVSVWNEPESTGLVKFDGVDWTFYNSTNSGFPESYIRNIKVSNSGVVWMTTQNNIVLFDNDEWTIFESSNPEGPIIAIDIDEEDVVWVSSGAELLSYKNDTWNSASISGGIGGNGYIYSIKCDNEGNKWLGTETLGVLVYNENGSSSISTPKMQEESNLKISPNPIVNFTEIEFELDENTSAQFSIFNIAGKMVFSKLYSNLQKGKNSISLNVSDFKNGTYLLFISTEKTKINGKFIVQKR